MARGDTGPRGVGLVHGTPGGLELCIAADDPPTAVRIAMAARDDGVSLAVVSTPDLPAAEALQEALHPRAAIQATRRLWTRQAPSLSGGGTGARELGPEDAHQFLGLRFPDGRIGWPGYRGCLAAGLRYFGVFVDGRLISLAGMVRLTRHHTELIGVATFRPEDRRRGHAREACGAALAAALEDSPVITWTSDAANAASLATALSLGLRPYQAIHVLAL